jgi:hypothetical protein
MGDHAELEPASAGTEGGGRDIQKAGVAAGAGDIREHIATLESQTKLH